MFAVAIFGAFHLPKLKVSAHYTLIPLTHPHSLMDTILLPVCFTLRM